MTRFKPPFSISQQKVLALVPKVTSVHSMIGSFYIMQHVLCRPRYRSRVYHRLLLSMSMMDFIFAIKCFVSTWPMPASTPFVWAARGTANSCTAFGFLGHGAGLASAIYNGSLTLYFLLTITFSWREEKFHGYMEFLLHAVPLTIGWGTAIAMIPLDLYNPMGWTCWIQTFPPGCGGTYPCLRGDTDVVNMWRWLSFHAWLWFVFFLSAVAMILMCWSVHKREQAMKRYQFLSSSSSEVAPAMEQKESLSRKVAVQAFLYMFFFFLTWIFPMVQFVISQTTGYLYFPLLCLTVIFTPLQGFFDSIIYLRPRYLSYRKRQQGGAISRRTAAMKAVSAQGEDQVEGETFDPDEDQVQKPAVIESTLNETESPM